MPDELQQESQTESSAPFSVQSSTTPSVELKAKAKKLRWTAFAFILLCFVMPFVQVSCQQQKLMSFTGFQMAFGTEIQEPQMFGSLKPRKISSDALVLLSFLAAVAGLVCSFIKGKPGSLTTALCGAAGFIFMLIFKVGLDNEILKQSAGMLEVEYMFGFIASCFLFATSAALNGYFFYTEKTEPALLVSQTGTTEQFDRLKSSATGLAQQSREWFIKKNVSGWVQSHALLLSVIGGIAVSSFIVYYAFIKASPSADGKRAALAYTDCQNPYKVKVDSAYQSFLSAFPGQSNPTRANAEQKLDSLLTGERQVYNTCNEAADKLYNELAARYTDDSDGLAKFSTAFTKNSGGLKSADEIEQSSSLLAAVSEKIQAIRAPSPDSNRIAKDLLGQHMDRWNFSYASEFKDVKIITQKPDGDMLILRTHLTLEDYITKELYFTILDMKYTLNSNGEWDYDGFTQLLHDTPDTNYFVDSEIFLVGKWRWQGNTATYNPDGSWFGTWDDGTDRSGTWRIVKGNLVLTINGQNWVNKKIVKFSKNELIVDETTPSRAERIE